MLWRLFHALVPITTFFRYGFGNKGKGRFPASDGNGTGNTLADVLERFDLCETMLRTFSESWKEGGDEPEARFRRKGCRSGGLAELLNRKGELARWPVEVREVFLLALLEKIAAWGMRKLGNISITAGGDVLSDFFVATGCSMICFSHRRR